MVTIKGKVCNNNLGKKSKQHPNQVISLLSDEHLASGGNEQQWISEPRLLVIVFTPISNLRQELEDYLKEILKKKKKLNPCQTIADGF